MTADQRIAEAARFIHRDECRPLGNRVHRHGRRILAGRETHGGRRDGGRGGLRALHAHRNAGARQLHFGEVERRIESRRVHRQSVVPAWEIVDAALLVPGVDLAGHVLRRAVAERAAGHIVRAKRAARRAAAARQNSARRRFATRRIVPARIEEMLREIRRWQCIEVLHETRCRAVADAALRLAKHCTGDLCHIVAPFERSDQPRQALLRLARNRHLEAVPAQVGAVGGQERHVGVGDQHLVGHGRSSWFEVPPSGGGALPGLTK